MTVNVLNAWRAFVVACTLIPAWGAHAHEYKLGAITIVHPWARATAARVGGVFMMLENAGAASDRLVKVAAAAAETVELHETRIEGGTAMMRPVSAIEIKPGARTELKPGGLHVMLIGLKQPLKEGGWLKLTLTFEKAGTIEIDALIDKPGATGGHRH